MTWQDGPRIRPQKGGRTRTSVLPGRHLIPRRILKEMCNALPLAVWLSYCRFSEKQPRVIRRLRDTRLQDPVFLEVSDTHGIETSLLTVADFAGRKIINYRYSPVIFATQGGAKFGMGSDGKDEFECGGVMELPGSPFSLSATNVN